MIHRFENGVRHGNYSAFFSASGGKAVIAGMIKSVFCTGGSPCDFHQCGFYLFVPVRGASVFFYRHSHYSRVIRLPSCTNVPPWEKLPCPNLFPRSNPLRFSGLIPEFLEDVPRHSHKRTTSLLSFRSALLSAFANDGCLPEWFETDKCDVLRPCRYRLPKDLPCRLQSFCDIPHRSLPS